MRAPGPHSYGQRMTRVVRAVLLVAALLVVPALAACEFEPRPNRFEDDRTLRDRVTEVRIAGGNGSVSVRRGTGGEVTVHRRVTYRGENPTGRFDRVDGTTLRLDTSCGRRCSIGYVVTMPGAVKVTGHLGAGPIDLREVTEVSVSTDDGAIVVHDAAGPVRVRSGSGPITLRAVPEVVAQTDDGAITVHEASGPVSALAGSGPIDLAAVRKVTARTADGAITVRDAAGDAVVRTGSGPVHITDVTGAVEARTDDGAITLARIGGAVTTQTGSGPIDGEDLGGTRTVARTADGAIRLVVPTVQDIEAHSGSGPIRLVVPPAPDGYRVQTRAPAGPTQVHIATDPAGGRLLSVSTDDGAITIDPR